MSNLTLASLDEVYKSYGKVAALEGLNLQIRKGELLALLGVNGAGKTTAISLLLGLQKADGGQVNLFDQSPDNLAARRNIGVMMQEVFLHQELKVRELIELFSSYYPDGMTLAEVVELTNIGSFVEKRYGRLSGGQKRQVQFAIALCGRPKLLFLDEPTVGLDMQARQTLWATLRRCVRTGCSILLTTHYLEEAEALADRIVVLARGRVVTSGTVREVSNLVATRTVGCKTRTAPERIASWPGVCEARDDNGTLRMTVKRTQIEAVVRQLLAADAELTDLEISQAGLADAFLEITKAYATTNSQASIEALPA